MQVINACFMLWSPKQINRTTNPIFLTVKV